MGRAFISSATDGFDLVVRGGTLVRPRGRERADIGIADGKIVEIGDLGSRSTAEVIDAQGMCVLPGVIDTQVHFREPGLTHKEDLESGSRAAVCGGVTSYFEMPNTDPPTISEAALQDKLARAAGRSWANYAFFVGASPDNVSELARLESLTGTPGIKIFHGSSTGSLLVETEEKLRQVLHAGRRRCPIHSEDEARLSERKTLTHVHSHVRMHPILRDPEAAAIATRRCIRLCEETGRPIHILHVSTADEIAILADAKSRGVNVTCEVTPQHLTITDSWYESHESFVQMNPPVRSLAHREAIREGLKSGLFDVIGSDHAPHTRDEKERPYPTSPSGMPGVQTLLSVMLTLVAEGLLSLERLVELTSEAPAKLYGVRKKGSLEPGYDADLVILDPDADFEVQPDWLQSKCAWSPWQGHSLKGQPQTVLVNGKVSVRNARPIGRPAGTVVQFDPERAEVP